MLQHCVARIAGQVTCGDLRWNVTAYLPFVVTLFRLPMSGDGELAAACFRIDLFVTRSMENFTSAESNELPSWNVTPLRRLQRHVFGLPTGKHLVASSGSSFGPFVIVHQVLEDLIVERERAVVVRSRWVDVRDRVRGAVDERAARRGPTERRHEPRWRPGGRPQAISRLNAPMTASASVVVSCTPLSPTRIKDRIDQKPASQIRRRARTKVGSRRLAPR